MDFTCLGYFEGCLKRGRGVGQKQDRRPQAVHKGHYRSTDPCIQLETAVNVKNGSHLLTRYVIAKERYAHSRYRMRSIRKLSWPYLSPKQVDLRLHKARKRLWRPKGLHRDPDRPLRLYNRQWKRRHTCYPTHASACSPGRRILSRLRSCGTARPTWHRKSPL